MLRVLIIDDEPEQLGLIERILRRDRFEVLVTDSPMGASKLVRSFAPDVVLIDLNLPAVPGDHLLPVIRRCVTKPTRFVLFSSADEDELREAVSRCGADGWISKSTIGPMLGQILRGLVGG